MSGASHDKKSSGFKTFFNHPYSEFSFNVHWFFLGQLAQKLQAFKVSKKGPIYLKMDNFWHFQLWRLVTFEPVDLGKIHIHQKKADAMSNFFPYSKSSISGLSNDVSFIHGSMLEVGQTKQNVWLKI